MKPFGSSNLQNHLKLREKILKTDHSALLVRIADQLSDSPFGVVHRRLALAFNIVVAQHTGTKGEVRPLGDSPSGLVQQFNKDVSNSATQDSIMNVHNKTQFTYARINCVLKGSSCDTQLPKILKLAILSSNASSTSTKAFECPHKNDDSIFTLRDHKGFNKACNEVECKGMCIIGHPIIRLPWVVRNPISLGSIFLNTMG
ncbi:hypothetical protein H5410_036982 [Solanum commersonii]|uniref:Uncharacterized protein n=1 Tax=Solanum commersonii TaxID=4109 RepID=A0A9J5Y9U9_SOLCO|nr:hypothetical protein H5410_036982 [Solanum commersonii]